MSRLFLVIVLHSLFTEKKWLIRVICLPCRILNQKKRLLKATYFSCHAVCLWFAKRPPVSRMFLAHWYDLSQLIWMCLIWNIQYSIQNIICRKYFIQCKICKKRFQAPKHAENEVTTTTKSLYVKLPTNDRLVSENIIKLIKWVPLPNGIYRHTNVQLIH